MCAGPVGETSRIAAQTIVQGQAVAVAILRSAIGSALVWALVKYTIGLRVEPDAEREGLDLTEHGERAYNL